MISCGRSRARKLACRPYDTRSPTTASTWFSREHRFERRPVGVQVRDHQHAHRWFLPISRGSAADTACNRARPPRSAQKQKLPPPATTVGVISPLEADGLGRTPSPNTFTSNPGGGSVKSDVHDIANTLGPPHESVSHCSQSVSCSGRGGHEYARARRGRDLDPGPARGYCERTCGCAGWFLFRCWCWLRSSSSSPLDQYRLTRHRAAPRGLAGGDGDTQPVTSLRPDSLPRPSLQRSRGHSSRRARRRGGCAAASARGGGSGARTAARRLRVRERSPFSPSRPRPGRGQGLRHRCRLGAPGGHDGGCRDRGRRRVACGGRPNSHI